jgi:hypothetical protein
MDCIKMGFYWPLPLLILNSSTLKLKGMVARKVCVHKFDTQLVAACIANLAWGKGDSALKILSLDSRAGTHKTTSILRTCIL